MKKYELDPKKTMDYFKENLEKTNKLSDSILLILRSQPGRFYAFLPEGTLVDKIHEFNTGGKTKCLRKEMSSFVLNLLNTNKDLCCIVDDFNSNLNHVENDEFYKKNGIHFEDEVYYLVKSGADGSLVEQCLQYSSAIWHSLCVISEIKLNNSEKKVVTKNEINAICENAIFVMIGAYDSESYIFWERDFSHEPIPRFLTLN